jgi:hypothetical protein
MVGAVAGSPGTLPTNWGSAPGGLTQTIVALGTENGLQYMDVRFNGTATGVSSLINLEASNTIAASNGQTWTQSIYCKIIANPQAPTFFGLFSVQRASGSNVGTFTNSFTATTTLQRFAATNTTNAIITAIQPYFIAGLTIGATYDFTIRIAAPQMELGAYATTFIPTTTAAVTRVADAASKTGVSSLIGQTEGTLFAEVDTGLTAGSFLKRILHISDGTALNTIFIAKTSSDAFFGTIANGNVTQATFQTATNQSGIFKIALGYALNNVVMFVNGVQVGTTDTSATIPATSVIDLGSRFGTLEFNDRIAQAALFPTRLTNAQLAEITTL